MAGSVLSVGVVACTAMLAVGLTAAGAGAVFSQRIAGVADAAALAAADAASGAVSGDPCDRAAEVASASGADVVACDLDGLVATVTVSGAFGRLAAMVSARAGPSPDDAAHSARLSSGVYGVLRRKDAPVGNRQEARHRRVTDEDEVDPGVPRRRL